MAKKNLISTIDTKIKIGPIDNKGINFNVASALVFNKMSSIDQNCPNASNLGFFKNATDLIQENKFPNIVDSSLHVIIGVREAGFINFEKINF